MGSLGLLQFKTSPDGGAVRAKRMAAILIEKSKNNYGEVTDPTVYERANAILEPYSSKPDVMLAMERYNNKADEVKQKTVDQDTNIASIQRHLADSLFFKQVDLIDTSRIAQMSLVHMEDALGSVNALIDESKARGKSYDKLVTYQKSLNDLASSQRNLVNSALSGNLSGAQDAFGYYVKTDPTSGNVMGVAMLPKNQVSVIDKSLDDNTKRISNNVKLGSADIPVYVPAYQNGDGSMVAKIGGNTWTGEKGDSSLAAQDIPDFSGTGYVNLSDQNKFKVKQF